MTTAPAHLKHGYSTFQIAVHWTVAALVVANLLLGSAMARAFDAELAGQELDTYGPAYVHIATGASILLLMVARLARRVQRPVATNPDSPHKLLALLGRINHWAFYGILLAMPLLGIVAWFGESRAAGNLHSLLVYVLFAALALHVGAVIVHHLFLRENLIRRMVRPT